MSAKNERHYELRELESVRFASKKVEEAFRRFCAENIFPRVTIDGYKQDQKRKLLTQQVFELLRTGLAGRVVADRRGTWDAKTRERAKLWDKLEAAGLCEKCLGSEASEKVTRYHAKPELLKMRRLWAQDLLRARKTVKRGSQFLGLVIFKKKDEGKSLPIPIEETLEKYAPRDASGNPDRTYIAKKIRVIKTVERLINRINGENIGHSWATTNDLGVHFQPNIELVQMHIREPFRGTRLYTPDALGGQNIPKKMRRRMRIDGRPSVEFDFSCSLLRLAYHLRKIPVAERDVYRPAKIVPEIWYSLTQPEKRQVRDLLKKATLICLNVGSRKTAIGAVAKELKKHPDLRNMPPPQEIVKRIAAVHSQIADDLFANRGMALTDREGFIMFKVMQDFVLRSKKPALPIHDALVVRKEDAALAKQTMEKVYREVTQGFSPVVECKSS